MKIFSAKQFYKADKQTLKTQKITAVQLMERAGTQIFKWVQQQWKDVAAPIHIFCGMGNNGGDGLVVGRLLMEHGFNVLVYVVNYSANRSNEFSINYDRLLAVAEKAPIQINEETNLPEIKSNALVVDAIFGIGLNRSPEGWIKRLIGHLNESSAFKLAIDIPSGLFPNLPLKDFDAVFKADHTLTFQAPKLSFFLPETAPFVSEFTILDIGLDADFLLQTEALATVVTEVEAKNMYRPRHKFGHKGTYGHALLIAGSYGKIGAAVLSTSAAFRIGAGMVTAFVPKCGYSILQTTIPEAMVLTDAEENFISNIKYPFQPAAIGIGMGIGKNGKTKNALKKLFQETQNPLVIDADALNILSENRELLKLVPKNSVLTPHPGELERLIGAWTSDYEKLEKVKQFSNKYHLIVVVKGAYTVILSGEEPFINSTGNPGMGTAGSGDALSGVITGLISQGYPPVEAAVLGVYLHGKAGDIAAHSEGEEAVMAGDIIKNLGKAFLSLHS